VRPPFLNAGNVGPFTLDGTRTYRVGTQDVVLIDPGPDVKTHVRALRSWVSGAERVTLLLTHGHADHAAATRPLADALGATVRGPVGIPAVDEPLADGEAVATDQGSLIAVRTPGHAREHHCYHWPDGDALFVGDLLLGEGDTTWVAEYPGCVADYLASLERVRALAPATLYPTHGPPLDDVSGAIDRYEAHRRGRIEQVARAMAAHPHASTDELLDVVYGAELHSGVRAAAMQSLGALVDFVRGVRAS